MQKDLFEELVQSVHEGGAILRGEAEPARITKVERMTVHGIPVDVRFDGKCYFVSDNILDIYGSGDTLDEASADYWLAVQDAYADLLSHSDRLAPHLQKQLTYLSQIFTERETDKQLAAMANDESYRILNETIAEEFAESDWEALELAEKQEEKRKSHES